MNNISDYEILKMVEESIQAAVNDAADLIQNFFRIAVYNRKPSKRYDRLGENGGLLSAFDYGIVYDTGSEFTFQVYDEENMEQSASGIKGRFNHHMSLNREMGSNGYLVSKINGLPGATSYGGKTISEWLIEWYDTGTKGGRFPSVPDLNYVNIIFGKYGGLEGYITKVSLKYFLEKYNKRMGR